jgi:WD40 repeat protein
MYHDLIIVSKCDFDNPFIPYISLSSLKFFPRLSCIARRLKIVYNKTMGEKNELDAVVEMLTQWVTAVKLRNALNYTDINRTAENLTLRLLNMAYDYNLKNLNWDQNNYPAVDLGDHECGIAFQVTASADLKKIKDTVVKFYAPDGLHKEFSRGLYFFFVKEKTPALSVETKQKLKTKYGFNADRQMLSIKEVMVWMEELYSTDRERFLRVKDLLAEEWGYGAGKINRCQVLEELYRGSKRYLSSLRGGGGRFRYLKISDTLLVTTRKSQRKECLDTPVIVDGKADEFPDEERVSTSVLEAIPRLWQKECRHAMLKGEGGMGKTVSFIRLWEQYIAGDDYNPLLPVPVFIPLNEYNETDESERKGFIQGLIRRFYLDKKTREEELLDVFRESVNVEKSGVPSVILLLDGLNEVTVERTGLLVELREIIEHWQGVQMLVSSRPDMRDTLGWTDFHLLELKGLSNEQIDKYLGQWGLSLLKRDGDEEKYPLRRLLQNPMMLTIYTASCEVVKEYGISPLYDFKQRVETPGELLWNFMESQVVKYFQQRGLNERQKYYYKFLLKIMLPALGYEMEKAGRFQFAGNDLDVIVERYLNRFCQADFLRTFREYRGRTAAWRIDEYDLDKMFGKMESVLKILSDDMSMLVKEGYLYRFLHQDFRDFFAAVHILNEVGMGLNRDVVAEVLTGGMISFYLRCYMAEIEGDHYCKPYLEEGKGWQIKSNESNLLAQALEKCRGHFTEPYAHAVSNILHSWKEVRGEWSGLDLSRLDLSKVFINGTVCYQLYKKTYLSVRFDESLIHVKFFFPQGHSHYVNSAVYSPDGKKILSASSDGTIKVWDVVSGTCLRTYQGHESFVTSAVFNPDGQRFISASGDKIIKEWDVSNGICLRVYKGHEDCVFSAVYSADGKKILSASWDKTLKEWDVYSGTCLRTYNGHEKEVNSAVYSPDGQKILSTSSDYTIKEWDISSDTCLRTYQGHKDVYTEFSPDGQNWYKYVVTNAIYSPDGQKILSASWDNTIKEWDVSSGTCLRNYQGHKDVVVSAIYSANGRKILSASWDETIKEWDVGSGTCLRTYQGHAGSVNSAVYSADGKKILSASTDKTIKEWDVESEICLQTYKGHKNYITSAIYSADGQKVLFASLDKTIKEWDVKSKTCLRVYHGHKNYITCAVYSDDGKKILSASWDVIKEWDVETGKCLKTWHKKNDAPLSDYPDFTNTKTFENRLFRESNQIKIINPQTKQILHTLINIPGLYIQGCSFLNLHPQSHLTAEHKRLLKMYGGTVE